MRVTLPFAEELLDALNIEIAVLDESGTIVAVNEAWRRFARQRDGNQHTFYVGDNYLSACRSAMGSGESDAATTVFSGILDLLNGTRSSFAADYPCHSPNDRRWFNIQAARFTYKEANYLLAAHQDVTWRIEAEDRLRESETTLRRVLDTLPIGVWIMNPAGHIVHGNPAGQQIWGGARYVGPEQFGEYKGWWLSSGRPVAADEWAAARAIQKGETSIDEEIRIQCFDGSSRIILNSAVPLRDDVGGISGAIIINQDVTARKRVEEELRLAHSMVEATNRELERLLAREHRAAHTDELTGLRNRRDFYAHSQPFLNLAQRHGTPLSILICDVDHFKQVNDAHGHLVGDAVLKRVAEILSRHTRDCDILARCGGDEFIVAMPHTPVHDALTAAEHLRESVGAHQPSIESSEVPVTLSVGVAEAAAGVDTLDALIQRADQALYAAKGAGRNCSRAFSFESLRFTQRP